MERGSVNYSIILYNPHSRLLQCLLSRSNRTVQPVNLGCCCCDMELWQQQGFKSFGDWRRATEKARRAAKKEAASTAVGAPLSPRRFATPPTPASWQPPEVIQSGAPPRSPPSSPLDNSPDTRPDCSQLYEYVQVTPHGSRAHAMKHTSPGGTVREKEYVSPAGAPHLDRVERVQIWQLQIERERRYARYARIYLEPRALRRPTCAAGR